MIGNAVSLLWWLLVFCSVFFTLGSFLSGSPTQPSILFLMYLFFGLAVIALIFLVISSSSQIQTSRRLFQINFWYLVISGISIILCIGWYFLYIF